MTTNPSLVGHPKLWVGCPELWFGCPHSYQSGFSLQIKNTKKIPGSILVFYSRDSKYILIDAPSAGPLYLYFIQTIIVNQDDLHPYMHLAVAVRRC